MRLSIKHIDLFGGGMQDFPNFLEGLRAHCEARFIPKYVVFCSYIPFRSYLDFFDEAVEECGFRLRIFDIVSGKLIHGPSDFILREVFGIKR